MLSFLKYDDKGNVVSKTLYGAISTASKKLKVEENGYLHPSSQHDSYEVVYEYSQDSFNLKISESYPDGTVIKYVYEPGTDKIAAVLNYKANSIVSRSFYFYEKHGHAYLEIHDDGSSVDVEDMTGVYHRKGTRRTIFNDGPHKGLISREECFYWDCDEEIEKLSNSIEYTYNNKRRVTSKFHQEYVQNLSYKTDYDYDEHGNVIYETDARGSVIERRFDVDDRVLWEKGPDSRIERFFAYDADRRLAKCTEKHADYSDLEWITSYRYDALGRIVELTGPSGEKTSYAYDWAGRIVVEERSNVLDEFSNVLTSYRKTFGYDWENRKIYQKDEKGHETQVVFNLLGQTLWQSSESGKTEEYVYSPTGRLEKKVYNEGPLTEYYYYNDLGQHCRTEIDTGSDRFVSKEIAYRGCQKLSETDALGHQDTYRYDGLGRLIEHIRLDANTGICAKQEWKYDGWGRKILCRQWQDESNYIEEHSSYNAAGDQVACWRSNSEEELFKEGSFTYDEVGRCLKTVIVFEGQEYETLSCYDSFGNILLQKDEEGYETSWVYTYQLNQIKPGVAVMAMQHRKDGSLKESFMNARGQEICQKLFDPDGKLIQHQCFGYDCGGALVYRKERAIRPNQYNATSDGASDEEQWVETKIEYGPDRLVTKRFDNYRGALERVRSWEYDKYGHCVKKTEPSGLFNKYEYDARGFLTRCISSDGSIDYAYEHDYLGQLICARNNITEKTTTRSYDAWGRVVEDLLEEGGLFTRHWNALGQPVKDVYPSQKEVSREYVGGLLRRIHTSELEHTIDRYDSTAHAVLESQPLGLGVISSVFDVKGRLTSFSSQSYVVSDVQYDQMGNLVSRLVNNEKCQRYEYDFLGQLKRESDGFENFFTHDSRYRRLEKNNEITALDELDQIYSIHRGEETESCEYDLDGHLIQRTIGDVVWQYTYDAWSRLTDVTGPQFKVSYSYDAFNRRISAEYLKDNVSSRQTFGYLGQMLAVVANSESQEERYFVRGVASERGDTLAWMHEGVFYVPIHDMSGSCIGWRDASGNTVASWSYDSFGNPSSQEWGPWGFWGKYKDSLTGMVYFGLRDYIPEQGRWLTRDPKGEIDSSNLYVFVGNNPVTRCDEWGAFSLSQTCSGIFDGISGFFSDVRNGFCPQFHDEVRNANEDVALGNLSASASCVIWAQYKGDNPSDVGGACRVNGIGTTYKEAVEGAIKLCEDLRRDVYCAYNYSAVERFSTAGIVIDAARALCQRTIWNFQTGSELAFRQAIMLTAEMGLGEILCISHSHGMQVTTNAERFLANGPKADLEFKAVLERVHINALAGSGRAENYGSFKSFLNTVCTNDMVIRAFDGGAIEQQRAAGILKEPDPVVAPDANSFGKIKTLVMPDHYLIGPTCTDAYNQALKDLDKKCTL